MEFLPIEIQEYAEKHTSAESALLQELNRETNLKVLYPRMLCGHFQGRFLSMISKLTQPKTILEIGTYTGYSAICLAEGLRKDGKIITIDINEELSSLLERYFEQAGIRQLIDLRFGNAMELIPEIKEELDMVLIDADKQNYTRYYQMVLPKLRKGGLILADNVLWSGQVIDENVNDKETDGLKEFSKFVTSDPSVDHILLPIRDGIMMVRKK